MTEAVALSVGGQSVSRETFQALRDLESLVRRWNPAINLVSKNTVPQLWDRHIVDSAQIFSLCPPGARLWVDLGSGGGFPGLVVAILAREQMPDLHVKLVESDLRKSTFLRQAAYSLGLSVTVATDRIETLTPMGADVLSARALAALPSLVEYAAIHMKADGVAIFPKGARHQEELSEARRSWTFDVDSRPSLSDGEAAILVIRNIHRVRND